MVPVTGHLLILYGWETLIYLIDIYKQRNHKKISGK